MAHARTPAADSGRGAPARLYAALANALLGPHGRQRMRVSQTLLALVVYVLFAGLQHAEVLMGLIDPVSSSRLTTLYLTCSVLFYVVVRSGVNTRLTADPSLTIPQTIFGLLVSAGSYAITGPARGAVMALMVLILVFSMFALRPAQSRALALFSFALFATVMLVKSRTDPLAYPPVIETVHFVFAGIVVAAVSVLAGNMGAIRARLLSQKLELENALERIADLATRDGLTGLFNRRHMTTLLQAELARQRRDNQGMTLALLDIDLFKRINDEHGHQVGDRVLKAFADAGMRSLRATDVLARWGGEEFLLMMPGTSPQAGLRSVERLRETFAQAPLHDITPGLTVTFSAGLSGCYGDGPLEASIDQADRAMYRAKHAGRNRSLVF